MTRELNSLSQEKIKGYESYRDTAYDDARPNYTLQPGDQPIGVLTIGWGHTGDVVVGQTCTPEQAQAWFEADTLQARQCVESAVTVPLNDYQFGALVSFVFNIGCAPFRSSTLLKKLNDRDYEAVPVELQRWNKQHVGGKLVVDNGLTIRRASECGLWVTGSPARGANITPDEPEPLWRAAARTAHVKLKAAGATLTGLGVTGTSLQDAGHKLSDAAAMWHTLAHTLAFIGIGFVVVGIVVELFKPSAT